MLEYVKWVGLNLNQLAVALNAIHPPVTQADVVNQSDIPFLPCQQVRFTENGVKELVLFFFAPAKRIPPCWFT